MPTISYHTFKKKQRTLLHGRKAVIFRHKIFSGTKLQQKNFAKDKSEQFDYLAIP